MPAKQKVKYKRKSSLDNINFHYDHKKHKISFYYAAKGLGYAFSTQPNFRFHTFSFVLMLVLSFFFKITSHDFSLLLIVSGFVIVSEMFNTSIEALADQVSKGEILKLIGVAKDISAGAVFVSAVTAGLVGISIFLPYFMFAIG